MTWGRKASRTLILNKKLSEREKVDNLSNKPPEGEGPLEEKSRRLSSTDKGKLHETVGSVSHHRVQTVVEEVLRSATEMSIKTRMLVY